MTNEAISIVSRYWSQSIRSHTTLYTTSIRSHTCPTRAKDTGILTRATDTVMLTRTTYTSYIYWDTFKGHILGYLQWPQIKYDPRAKKTQRQAHIKALVCVSILVCELLCALLCAPKRVCAFFVCSYVIPNLYVCQHERFLAAVSSSRSPVVRPSVRRLVGRRAL